jgi:hypothetical protein
MDTTIVLDQTCTHDTTWTICKQSMNLTTLPIAQTCLTSPFEWTHDLAPLIPNNCKESAFLHWICIIKCEFLLFLVHPSTCSNELKPSASWIGN